MKNYAKTSGDNISSSRKAFANMLWRAFPPPSEHDLSIKAARFYQVRAAKALRAHHAPKAKSEKYFTKVGL